MDEELELWWCWRRIRKRLEWGRRDEGGIARESQEEVVMVLMLMLVLEKAIRRECRSALDLEQQRRSRREEDLKPLEVGVQELSRWVSPASTRPSPLLQQQQLLPSATRRDFLLPSPSSTCSTSSTTLPVPSPPSLLPEEPYLERPSCSSTRARE